ncbi:hypothetical protein CLOM_g13712 [Closterium sp. NIES-68]|nr:hypothetical protein CLOM_g13712 [Closterium sp. NIES-68]
MTTDRLHTRQNPSSSVTSSATSSATSEATSAATSESTSEATSAAVSPHRCRPTRRACQALDPLRHFATRFGPLRSDAQVSRLNTTMASRTFASLRIALLAASIALVAALGRLPAAAAVAPAPVAVHSSMFPPLLALGKALRVPSSYGWSGTRECNDGWTGVVCDADGKPISIQFMSTWSGGSLSDDVTQLTSLQSLLLDKLNMNGEIPTGMESLQLLTALALNGKYLGGYLPAAIGQLTNLAHLSIRGGELSGSLPVAYSALTRLILLTLGSKASFGQTSNIRGTLPPAYSSLVALQYLDLGFNRLSGPIPTSWGALGNLFSLSMPNNLLSQRIPKPIASLPHLDYVNLANNVFTGPIPAFSDTVDRLMLPRNLHTGNLPHLPSLITALSLAHNLLTGPLPNVFPPQLESLDLRGNYFVGVVQLKFGLSPASAEPLSSCANMQLAGNCLTSASDCASKRTQRAPFRCKNLCGNFGWNSKSTSGTQCGGLGSCRPLFPRGRAWLKGSLSRFPFLANRGWLSSVVWACKCNAGARPAILRGFQTCVKM